MCNTSIVILQSNVIQLGGVVETSCLASWIVKRPKWSTVPLLFDLELSKSRDADGLLTIGGETFFWRTEGRWIAKDKLLLAFCKVVSIGRQTNFLSIAEREWCYIAELRGKEKREQNANYDLPLDIS